MKSITLDDLLEMHAIAIGRYGGATGVRDVGRLDAALSTQTQSVFGTELYVGLYEKAAAIMRGIIADHPFYDGNKRTGTLVALTFLELNGHRVVAKVGEVEDFAVSVATDHLDIPAIAAWLEANTIIAA